jgi:putative ABC transport system permease protein
LINSGLQNGICYASKPITGRNTGDKTEQMLKNYIKIAWRSLFKNKAFSAINIAGLAVGIAVCLLIMLFVQDELSYDGFNDKAGQIVRVVFRGTMNGEKMKEASVMAPVAPTLRKDFPEVLDATRLLQYGSPKITVGNTTFKDASFAYVDSNFFQVFTLPLIKGDAKTALVEPNTVVITEAISQKYFGNADPIGKLLNLKDVNQLYRVSGVMKEIPANSHFHFDILGSMASVPDARSASWMSGSYFTYLVLQKGYDHKKLEAKLPQEIDRYVAPQLLKGLGVSLADFRKKGNDIGLYLQPLTDIHLKSDFSNGLEPGGDIRYVYIFGVIALFMLLIACINFMNLSTAAASKRVKEVGIRKVLGSVKYELIAQFLLESALLTLFSLLLALALIKVSLPAFNELSGKHLRLNLLQNPSMIFGLLLFWLFVSILAGSYPAFYLSSFKPISVLKSKFIDKGRNISFRSALVVFQFVISVGLIIGTTVVYQQLSYIRNVKLGYDKEQLLVLRNSYLLGNKEDVLKEQLLHDPRVASVTSSAFLPAGPTDDEMSSSFPDGDRTKNSRVRIYHIDENYIPTMGMKIVEGRNFSTEFPSDSSKDAPTVIINETLAKVFGWGKNAVGHTVNLATDNEGGKKGIKVVGVVQDFHYRSLHEAINPLLMVLQKSSGLIIKVKTKDIGGLVATIKKQWDAYKIEEPFTYAFVDELYNQTFIAEQKTATILNIFAGLTIFIACLGLFGLATFTAEQRKKEIGIRKVLGASIPDLLALLSKEFVVLVGIAILIAMPIAWWAMSVWLQDFAYRVTISGWVFVMAGVAAICIALLTVSFQAVKAALVNPTTSLKAE